MKKENEEIIRVVELAADSNTTVQPRQYILVHIIEKTKLTLLDLRRMYF